MSGYLIANSRTEHIPRGLGRVGELSTARLLGWCGGTTDAGRDRGIREEDRDRDPANRGQTGEPAQVHSIEEAGRRDKLWVRVCPR